MGRVAAPHGVRGALKVRPLSSNPSSLLGFAQWWLRPPRADAWTAHGVRNGQLRSGIIVAELDDIRTRETAAALRGAIVGVPEEWLPAPGEGEYYQSDLVGMTVVNRNGELLGHVVEFVESGAHPIMRIGTAEGAERLIPWVAHYIDGVDTAERRIEVDWPADY
jgi:16S rRNA processing protein RimM